MMKKILLVLILFMFIPILNGCTNDAGIIKWTLKDEVLDWKNVKDAAYYKIIFYQDDLVTEDSWTNDHFTFIAYSSEYSFYGIGGNTATFYIKVKVFYEDDTTDESDVFQIDINRDYLYPTKVSIGEYVGHVLSWTDMSYDNPNFKNYTVEVNDDKFDMVTNRLDLEDYDDGIYKIQVKANYEDGSSIWTHPYYANKNVAGDSLQDSYDPTSGEDYSYTLDNGSDIVAVQGSYYIYNSNAPLPDDIVSIDGSTFTVNHYYIETEGHIADNSYSIIMQFYIITETNVYSLYLMNEGNG